jgi:hypothetical protein
LSWLPLVSSLFYFFVRSIFPFVRVTSLDASPSKKVQDFIPF